MIKVVKVKTERGKAGVSGVVAVLDKHEANPGQAGSEWYFTLLVEEKPIWRGGPR